MSRRLDLWTDWHQEQFARLYAHRDDGDRGEIMRMLMDEVSALRLELVLRGMELRELDEIRKKAYQ